MFKLLNQNEFGFQTLGISSQNNNRQRFNCKLQYPNLSPDRKEPFRFVLSIGSLQGKTAFIAFNCKDRTRWGSNTYQRKMFQIGFIQSPNRVPIPF